MSTSQGLDFSCVQISLIFRQYLVSFNFSKFYDAFFLKLTNFGYWTPALAEVSYEVFVCPFTMQDLRNSSAGFFAVVFCIKLENYKILE